MKKTGLLLIAFMMIFLLSCDKPGKKVLLVFSYHAEFEWVKEELKGVEIVLDDENYDLETFYMDTKRNTSREYMTDITGKVMQKIDSYGPDLIMLFDDNATSLVGLKLAGKEVPVVFCGVNGHPSEYWTEAPNITGVLEREYTIQAFNVAKSLVPGIESIALFLDDSPTSNHMLNVVVEGPKIPGLKHIIKTNDYSQWQKQLLAMQDSVDCIGIYAYFTIKDTAGNPVKSTDIIQWTLENNNLPEFAILDITINDGALCGAVETGSIQGISAANIAIRIFNGDLPSDIPYEKHDRGEVFINKNRAATLGITIPDGLGEDIVFIE